jgi:hypothetical protein
MDFIAQWRAVTEYPVRETGIGGLVTDAAGTIA